MLLLRVVHIVCYALATLGMWGMAAACLLSLFHRQWEDALICFALWWVLKVAKYYAFETAIGRAAPILNKLQSAINATLGHYQPSSTVVKKVEIRHL